MPYRDIDLTCRGCGAPFIFTAGEQEFYADKGFLNEPTRCPQCRNQRGGTSNAAPRSTARREGKRTKDQRKAS